MHPAPTYRPRFSHTNIHDHSCAETVLAPPSQYLSQNNASQAFIRATGALGGLGGNYGLASRETHQ